MAFCGKIVTITTTKLKGWPSSVNSEKNMYILLSICACVTDCGNQFSRIDKAV